MHLPGWGGGGRAAWTFNSNLIGLVGQNKKTWTFRLEKACHFADGLQVLISGNLVRRANKEPLALGVNLLGCEGAEAVQYLPEPGCGLKGCLGIVKLHDVVHVDDGGEWLWRAKVLLQGVNEETRVPRKGLGKGKDVGDAGGLRHKLAASGVAAAVKREPAKVVDHVSVVHLGLPRVRVSKPVAIVGLAKQREEIAFLKEREAGVALGKEGPNERAVGLGEVFEGLWRGTIGAEDKGVEGGVVLVDEGEDGGGTGSRMKQGECIVW